MAEEKMSEVREMVTPFPVEALKENTVKLYCCSAIISSVDAVAATSAHSVALQVISVWKWHLVLRVAKNVCFDFLGCNFHFVLDLIMPLVPFIPVSHLLFEISRSKVFLF